MKPIDFSLSDIPSDFRLVNYNVCATWGVDEWWLALTHRSLIHTLSIQPVEEITEGAKEAADSIEFFKECALNYLEDPMPRTSEEDRLYPANMPEGLISDLTGSDLYLGLYKLGHAGYEAASELAQKVGRRTGVLDARDIEGQQAEIEAIYAMAKLDQIPAWQIHRDANPVGDKFWINVELGAPDEDLVKEFKQWLKQIRKAAGLPKIPKRFDESHFADWHSKRLLPYLDLTLWARAHGGSLGPTVLGYALFPDEPARDRMRNVEPMIRRTVAPQAGQLVSWQVVNTLYAQMRGQSEKQ